MAYIALLAVVTDFGEDGVGPFTRGKRREEVALLVLLESQLNGIGDEFCRLRLGHRLHIAHSQVDLQETKMITRDTHVDTT